MIEQAQKLYAEAEPPIDDAMKELQTVGPAVQILIDVIGHHVNKGSSPAEAAEAVRTALNGSIKSVAHDHSTDLQMSRVTVFGGTGFIGRRIVRYLSEAGVTVRVASRHPGEAEGDHVEQIAAVAHDERSVISENKSLTTAPACINLILANQRTRAPAATTWTFAPHPRIVAIRSKARLRRGRNRSGRSPPSRP